MKIKIRSDEHKFTLWVPTGLLFSRATVYLFDKVGRKYAGDAMKNIPPEALNKIFAEFRRIKRKHGHWELVDLESADGDIVKIVL